MLLHKVDGSEKNLITISTVTKASAKHK